MSHVNGQEMLISSAGKINTGERSVWGFNYDPPLVVKGNYSSNGTQSIDHKGKSFSKTFTKIFFFFHLERYYCECLG